MLKWLWEFTTVSFSCKRKGPGHRHACQVESPLLLKTEVHLKTAVFSKRSTQIRSFLNACNMDRKFTTNIIKIINIFKDYLQKDKKLNWLDTIADAPAAFHSLKSKLEESSLFAALSRAEQNICFQQWYNGIRIERCYLLTGKRKQSGRLCFDWLLHPNTWSCHTKLLESLTGLLYRCKSSQFLGSYLKRTSSRAQTGYKALKRRFYVLIRTKGLWDGDYV